MTRTLVVDLDDPDSTSIEAVAWELRRRQFARASDPELARWIERRLDHIDPELARVIRRELVDVTPEIVLAERWRDLIENDPALGYFLDGSQRG